MARQDVPLGCSQVPLKRRLQPYGVASHPWFCSTINKAISRPTHTIESVTTIATLRAFELDGKRVLACGETFLLPPIEICSCGESFCVAVANDSSAAAGLPGTYPGCCRGTVGLGKRSAE